MFAASQFMFTGGRSRLRPRTLQARRFDPRGGIRDVMTWPDAIAHSPPYLMPIPGQTRGGSRLFRTFVTALVRAR
jgi:hypothetical protein